MRAFNFNDNFNDSFIHNLVVTTEFDLGYFILLSHHVKHGFNSVILLIIGGTDSYSSS